MDVEAAELQDWEILPSNRASESGPLNPDGSAGNTNGVDEVGSETIGVIQPNYFSLDSQIRYMSTFTGADGSEEDSEKSDNPSWIDPGCENNELTMKTCREFWSDSSSEIEGKNELDFEEMKSESGEEFWPDSVNFGAGAGQNSHLQEVSVEENQENGNVEGEHNGNVGGEHNGNVEGEQRRDAGDHKKSLVWWWKVPIQLVKYCAAFRVSPVWTFSVAAAMAFVILGRKLYKMKKTTKPLELKVTVDHKNVSQFTSRAGRLNEAFSIVKRVPLIRPQLPAAGDTLWPVMSLR